MRRQSDVIHAKVATTLVHIAENWFCKNSEIKSGVHRDYSNIHRDVIWLKKRGYVARTKEKGWYPTLPGIIRAIDLGANPGKIERQARKKHPASNQRGVSSHKPRWDPPNQLPRIGSIRSFMTTSDAEEKKELSSFMASFDADEEKKELSSFMASFDAEEKRLREFPDLDLTLTVCSYARWLGTRWRGRTPSEKILLNLLHEARILSWGVAKIREKSLQTDQLMDAKQGMKAQIVPQIGPSP